MALKFGKFLLVAALLPLITLPAKANWAGQATSFTPLVSSLVLGVREPAPAPSPAQQIFLIPQAVFYSYRHGSGQIYGMNLDGSVQLRLTKNTTSDTQPSLSLDGSKVVFIRYVGQYRNVFIMNADGTGQTQLTNNTSGTGDYTPAISPDKSKIVFQRDFSEIYIMNADGSNQRRLTNNNDWDGWPTFSPDGSKILFTQNDRICTMNLNGKNVTSITNNIAWSDFNAKFSPDEQKIVFVSGRDRVNNDRNFNIYNEARWDWADSHCQSPR